MTEDKNQQFNPFLEDRIKNQETIIRQLESQLATEYKILSLLKPVIPTPIDSFQEPTNNQDTGKRTNNKPVKPDIADGAVIFVLQNFSNKEIGLTNPEIERLIVQKKEIIISKNGVQASLDRLLKLNKVDLLNPEHKRNKRYCLKEDDNRTELDKLLG